MGTLVKAPADVERIPTTPIWPLSGRIELDSAVHAGRRGENAGEHERLMPLGREA